ncbi:MAG TPA: S8 family serine peptidase, partial [Rudaea sp.]|nr:S8 family serine peptidase [Rudaea sp.]
MKPLASALLPIVLGLSACATPVPPSPGTVLPDAARQTPDHFLVVTVRNDVASGGARAAGTTRGYDGIAAYSASSTARSMARAIATDYRLHEAASWPIALLGVHCIVYELPDVGDPRALVLRLEHDRRVESVQPLAVFATQSATYNDPYAGLQQSLGQMDVAQAQQWSRGDAIRLAVIDTGVDSSHPDLRGRIAEERNFVDADATAFHTDLHGTAVAGVIAADANNHIGIAGIAPGVQLLAYKACWHESGSRRTAVCNTFTLAQALAAAVDAHADIVNLSLAGPPDSLLTRIVERGLHRGVVFVGAAPPAGADTGFPGNVRGVLTVDVPGRRSGTAAALTAPGNDVLTLV